MERKLERNIRVIYLFSFFWLAMVIIPVIVPFYESKGLTLAEVYYLQAIFAFVVFLCEVPSGYVADMLGRKNALIAGSILHGIGFTWLCFADDFADLVWFEATLGVALSLVSGSDLSLLYDSQELLNQSPAQRTRGIANLRFVKSVSEGIAALIGGVLIAFSFDAVCAVNALFAWAPLGLALLLTEAPIARMESGQHVGNLMRVIRHLFLSDRLLRMICLSIALFGLMTFYVVWMLQPYWRDAGVPLTAFGLLWAGQSFLFAATTRLCTPLEERFGARPVLIAMALLPAFGYFGMAVMGGGVGIALSFSFFVSRGLNQVILTDALNRRVPGSYRATANSLTSFLFRAIYIVTGPMVGFAIDWLGMRSVLAILGIVAVALFAAVMVPMLSEVRIVEAQRRTAEGPAG